jgi:hypothetical protein
MTKHAGLILALILMAAVSASAQQVRVNHNRTPLRAEPTSTSTALALYQAGAALDIISVADGWYKVRDPKTKVEGYMMATLVDLLPGGTQPGLSPTSPQPTAKPPVTQPTPVPAESPVKPAPTAVSTPARQPPPPTQSGPPRTANAKPAAKANRWTDRGYLAIGGVYQNGAAGFSDEYSYTEYLEPVTVTTDYPAMKGPGFDVGGAVRVWRNLAVGVSVTGATRTGDATVSASIPHPFYFDKGRPVGGSVGVKRSDYAAHVHAMWIIPAGRRLLIAVGGGPTFFSVTQSLVESFRYTESYPYDSATFSSATVNEPSASAVGFGGTLEIGYYFSKNIGVGGTARYSSATVSFPSHDSTVKLDAGGFEAGLGLRVRFPKGEPKKAPAKPPIPAKPAKK